MATASATLSPAAVTGAVAGSGRRTHKRVNKVVYVGGLNSYGGLKAHNKVVSLGLPVCTEQCFAKIMSSLKKPTNLRGRSGGAFSSQCSAAGEIFKIAAIMNVLVLIGVAVGFILLRIEAFVEDEES